MGLRRRWFLATATTVLLGAGSIAFFGSDVVALLATDEPAWPCDREDRENTFPELPNERGYETRMELVRAWLPLAAEESGEDLARLQAAIAQTTGADRWEQERSRIYLDDQIFAELSLGRPSNKGWGIAYVWACNRAPD